MLNRTLNVKLFEWNRTFDTPFILFRKKETTLKLKLKLKRNNFFFDVLDFIKHSVCYCSIMFYCVFISRLPASSWTGRATSPKDRLEKQMD